jgi:tellurium resistance protein TerD
MAIQLKKGQRIDIGLQKLSVGLGWDPNPNASSFDYDLDASAFMIAADGQLPAEKFFVYYGNEDGSPDGAVKSSGDDRTGGNSDGDDEIITVDLERIDPQIEQIIFTVTIHEYAERNQNFGQVRNSFIRISDSTNGQELCKYDLDEDFSIETAIEFGRLYKRNNSWRFEAIGLGMGGGLQTFVDKYANSFA